MPAAAVRAVHRAYGERKVLEGFSMEVRRGEVFGLLGPNGAGKTTTLRLITGILLPDAGEVEVLGTSPTGPARRKVGYLPEERGLYPNMPLIDCLCYVAALNGVPYPEGRRRGSELLERLGLGDEEKTKFKELSAGMSQKAMFAATLLHGPDLLILDEPFFRLDPVNRRLVLAMLAEARRQGTAVVLSTHQMADAQRLCDRVLLLNHGVAVIEGTVQSVRESLGVTSGHLVFEGEVPPTLPGVANLRVEGREASFDLLPDAGTGPVLQALLDAGVEVLSFEAAPPSLDEVFVRTVQGP